MLSRRTSPGSSTNVASVAQCQGIFSQQSADNLKTKQTCKSFMMTLSQNPRGGRGGGVDSHMKVWDPRRSTWVCKSSCSITPANHEPKSTLELQVNLQSAMST